MSDSVPRHRKLPEFDEQPSSRSRHRKEPTAAASGRKARRIALTTGAVTAVGAVAAAVIIGLPALHTGTTADAGQASAGKVTDTLGSNLVGDVGDAMSQLPRSDAASSSPLGTAASAKPNAGKRTAGRPAAKTPAKAPATNRHVVTAHKATTSVYLNPLRKVSGLQAQRIDMGADFGGAGPVYAIGNAVITNATGNSAGWPGGGWITYQLTDGPAKGLVVFLAEDVKPTVQVGQHVTPNTVIANMFNGGAGIETGWAMPDGSSAESQLPEAGGISGQGPFPTAVGKNFDQLLLALGVPPSWFNANAKPFGVLPSKYPTSYSELKTKA